MPGVWRHNLASVQNILIRYIHQIASCYSSVIPVWCCNITSYIQSVQRNLTVWDISSNCLQEDWTWQKLSIKITCGDGCDVSNPWTWAQCDKCYKWRRLPPGFDKQLPEVWFCYMNHDAAHKFVLSRLHDVMSIFDSPFLWSFYFTATLVYYEAGGDSDN